MPLKVNNLIGFGAGGAVPFEYRSHTVTTADNTDPTFPVDIAAGDTLFAFAFTDSDETQNTPADWTSVDYDNTGIGNMAAHLVTKIADGTETGSISLLGAAADRGMVVAFSGGATSLGSIVDPNAQVETFGNISQVKNASTLGTLPFIVIGFYGDAASGETHSYSGATPDGVEGNAEMEVKFNIYEEGASPPDITLSTAGEGGKNGIASAIIEVVF